MPRYWISPDPGLRGNYDELYAWLDSIGAKECGSDSVATLVSNWSQERIARQLEKVLGQAARVTAGGQGLAALGRHAPGPRVYLISRNKGGRFIIGKRRGAPWSGYAVTEVDSEIEQ